MLSCIYEGKVFTTKEEGYTTEDKYRLGRERKLLCPVCKTSVYFCEDGEKMAHFTHHKVGDCPSGIYRSYDSTTENHNKVVDKFANWIKLQFPDIEVFPDYYINNELFTDIYFELEGIKIAIEIQFQNFNNNRFIRRREIYHKHNINDIWFFIRENEDYSIGSPYQRTYYRSNRRELYFYQIEEDVCKAYKGFAKEKWEKVGKNTLYNSVSVQVPLDHVKIRNDGTIIINELQNKYYKRLLEKREKNKKCREEQKIYREQQEKERQRRNEYRKNNNTGYSSNNSNSFVNNFSNFTLRQSYSPVYKSQPEKEIPKGSLLEKVIKYKKVMQDKAYHYEYKEYHFEIIDVKEYLNITIIYQGKKHNIKYLVLQKQVEKNEMYLTCRKETESDNIRYSIDINPFLDSLGKVKIQRYEMK